MPLRDQFLEAMSRAATSVSVVTTDGPGGRAGVTVSAMCSVSADRPSLLVCVHHLSPASAAIKANGCFCVNVLRADQPAISDTFAGRAEWRRLATGAPALDRPLAAFDCTRMKLVEWGTHFVLIGDIVDVETDAGTPLIYVHRGYGVPDLSAMHVA